ALMSCCERNSVARVSARWFSKTIQPTSAATQVASSSPLSTRRAVSEESSRSMPASSLQQAPDAFVAFRRAHDVADRGHSLQLAGIDLRERALDDAALLHADRRMHADAEVGDL